MSEMSSRTTSSLDEELQQFARDTGILPEWVQILPVNFLSNCKSKLSDVEAAFEEDEDFSDKRKILLALSRCPPQDIKVVVLGHDPIPDKSLATGFAFSFPEGAMVDENVGQRKLEFMKGESVRRLHDVLVDAGYLERGANYDCCHEVWADKGALLLNASLTHFNFDKWKDVVLDLLLCMVENNVSERLFFLCWGTNAKIISVELLAKLEKSKIKTQIIENDEHESFEDKMDRIVVFVGHHPTYPRFDNKFAMQAKIQFAAIREIYPDLFSLEKQPLSDVK